MKIIINYLLKSTLVIVCLFSINLFNPVLAVKDIVQPQNNVKIDFWMQVVTYG